MALVVAVALAIFVFDGAWDFVVVACGAAIELGEAAFWWRWTHRARPAVGVESLLDAEAIVVQPCNPDGRVRVAGELWAARCDGGAAAGERVVVRGVEGLVLRVELAADRRAEQ